MSPVQRCESIKINAVQYIAIYITQNLQIGNGDFYMLVCICMYNTQNFIKILKDIILCICLISDTMKINGLKENCAR